MASMTLMSFFSEMRCLRSRRFMDRLLFTELLCLLDERCKKGLKDASFNLYPIAQKNLHSHIAFDLTGFVLSRCRTMRRCRCGEMEAWRIAGFFRRDLEEGGGLIGTLKNSPKIHFHT
jgi:hypothetical protein